MVNQYIFDIFPHYPDSSFKQFRSSMKIFVSSSYDIAPVVWRRILKYEKGTTMTTDKAHFNFYWGKLKDIN